MAIENNYGGPPSLEIYQEFVRSSADSGTNQNAVVVAQHFDVVTADNTDPKDFKEYTIGTKQDIEWKDISNNSKSVKGEDVDKQSVGIFFREADAIQGTITGTVTGGNVIELDNPVDSLPETAIVGDVVRIDGSTIAEIVSIRRSETPATVTTVSIAVGKGKGSLNISGEYSGAKSRVYYIHIDKVDEYTDTPEKNKVVLTITTADGTDSDVIELIGQGTETISNSGLIISVKSWGFVKGDYYKFDANAKGYGDRKVIHLNKTVGSKTRSTVSVDFCKKRSFRLDKTAYSVSSVGITFGDLEQNLVFGSSYKSSEIVSGKFCVEFRAISNKYVNSVGYITADTIGEVGDTSIMNPLGAMVKVALKGGAGVYCVGVTSDTLNAYQKAFSLLSRSTDTYGIVLGSTDKSIIAAADTFVTGQADPRVANYKILYYGMDTNPEVTVMGESKVGKPILATLNNGVLTLANNDTTTGFTTSGVSEGDKVRINFRTDSFNNVHYDEYTVTSVISDTQIEVNSYNANIPVDHIFEVVRVLTGDELVTELKTRVVTANHRSCCVFGDGINIDGIQDAPAWLKAALPAGMRAGEYCQRPISNLEYSGCDADNKLSLSSSQLRDLASAGVWILANTVDGSSVYNYHQLTTDMSDKKKQEQSYTTNFDNISRGLRALMSPYYGNSNISQEFLQQMYANIVSFLGSKCTNAPNIQVGPQLIKYSNLSLYQDSVNKDHVYMSVDYDMPAPFNHITIRQRLI